MQKPRKRKVGQTPYHQYKIEQRRKEQRETNRESVLADEIEQPKDQVKLDKFGYQVPKSKKRSKYYCVGDFHKK